MPLTNFRSYSISDKGQCVGGVITCDLLTVARTPPVGSFSSLYENKQLNTKCHLVDIWKENNVKT